MLLVFKKLLNGKFIFYIKKELLKTSAFLS